MAQFTGYYSGLKEGVDTLSLQRARQEEANLRVLQRRVAEQEFSDRQKSKRILSDAYSANSYANKADSLEDYTNQIASQTEQAAKQVMAYDPQTGMTLLKQSQEERKNAFTAASNSLEIKKKQMEVAGAISGQVVDQSTLDDAVSELAKVGTIVPEKFRTWSPETKEWLDRRAMLSTNYLKGLELNQLQQRVQIQAEEAESKQQDRLAKQAAAVRKEQMAREKIEIGRKQYKPSKDEAKMVRSELKLLSDIDENFDALPSTEQDAAAKDVRYLKSAYMAEDPKLSEDLALQRARRAVVGRISNGSYPVLGSNEVGQEPQIKIFNGIEYVKVPGGWKRKQ